MVAQTTGSVREIVNLAAVTVVKPAYNVALQI